MIYVLVNKISDEEFHLKGLVVWKQAYVEVGFCSTRYSVEEAPVL